MSWEISLLLPLARLTLSLQMKKTSRPMKRALRVMKPARAELERASGVPLATCPMSGMSPASLGRFRAALPSWSANLPALAIKFSFARAFTLRVEAQSTMESMPFTMAPPLAITFPAPSTTSTPLCPRMGSIFLATSSRHSWRLATSSMKLWKNSLAFFSWMLLTFISVMP
ncbi:hypothetical protein J4Q44_G00176470, partial [Coregonus suidteri]